MIPLIGFAPDADSTTPGVITDCMQMIPYQGGMKAAPSAVAPNGVGPIAAACAGAAVMEDMTGARRTLAGAATSLYEYVGTAWTDVSRAIAYGGGVDSRWSFEQFGNTAMAANGVDFLQRSVGGAFSDVSGSPKADIIVSASGFLLAMNYNDGTVTPDGWYCSALYDETDWTPSVSTQATKGRLVSTEGKITAGMRLGSYVIAYKSKAIYIGQYAGAPVVWQWDQVMGNAGCIGKEAIADVGGAHVFVNDENFWLFDGTRPMPIGSSQVREWWLSKSDPAYRYRTIVNYDRQTNLVWFRYCSAASGGVIDSALVYHLITKQWGRADRVVEAALNFVLPGATIDGMDSYGSSIDALPLSPFDSQYWAARGQSLAFFDAQHQLQLLTGAAENSRLVTGDFGDDSTVTMLRKLTPRFERAPITAIASFSKKMLDGADQMQGGTSALVDNRFPSVQRARWHRAQIDFTGEVSVVGYQPELVANGRR